MNESPRLDRSPENATSEDREWRAAVQSLPTEIEPERDLWPDIASRLPRRAERRQVGRGPMLRIAAAALAAGVAGWFLLARPGSVPPLSPVPVVPPPSASNPGGGPAAAEGVAAAAYAETDRTLAEIRDELRRSIESRQDRLPPETRALVFENLRTIDRAIGEIEGALRGAPADAELVRTYVIYRERQIDLLRQANRMVARL
jgi:hypothetical protein